MGTIGNDLLVSNTEGSKDEIVVKDSGSEHEDVLSEKDDEKRTDSDIDSDSAVSVLNYLNDSNFRSPSRASSSKSDKSAIIRLNSELLKAKRSNWEVVDALNCAHDDIRDLRKREQRLNDLLRNNLIDGGVLNRDSVRRTEFKILNTQLEIRQEELSKTKDIVRKLMVERDRLKEECSRTRADLNLLSLQDKRKENELQVVQNNLRSLKEQQSIKDDNGFALRENALNLEHQLRSAKNAAQKAEEQIATLQETLHLRVSEIASLKNKLKRLEDENDLAKSQLNEKDAVIEQLKEKEQEVFKDVEQELTKELTTLQMKLNEMEIKSKEDKKKMAEMNEKLKEWERYGGRMSKSMDEYVHEVNSRQLEARQEIANYIENLEHQLSAIKSGQKPREESLTRRDKFRNKRRKSPELQQHIQSNLTHDSSDSSLSCGSGNHNSVDSLDFAHAQSDIEVLSDVSAGKQKGRRRTLPLTPSDIEALSDDGVMVNSKASTFDRNMRNRLPRRRRTQDSGLGESVIGREGIRESSRKSVYPWRQNSKESKPRFQTSSPVKCQGEEAGNDSDSFITITPLSAGTGSPNSSGVDSDVSDKQLRLIPKSKESRHIKREQVPLRRFLSHDRPRAHRRHAALLLVFRYLTPLELCSLARVCREWRSLGEHPSLWKNVAIVNTQVNNMSLLSISRRCKPTEKLTLKGLRRVGRDLAEMNDNCYLEKGLEYILKVAAGSLLYLHINDCENLLTDRCLLLTGSHCRNLQSFTYISEFYPACPEALWSLWNCRNLTCLRVPPMTPSEHPNRFNDKSCETIANCWPGLRKLTIGGLGMTSTGLTNIAQGCLRLQGLELDRTHYVTEETASAMCQLGLRGLQVLLFTFTPVSPAAVRQFYAACPRLEYMAIHVGISDYFSDVNNPENIRKYSRMVNKIEVLREENSDLARVLRIKADYG